MGLGKLAFFSFFVGFFITITNNYLRIRNEKFSLLLILATEGSDRRSRQVGVLFFSLISFFFFFFYYFIISFCNLLFFFFFFLVLLIIIITNFNNFSFFSWFY